MKPSDKLSPHFRLGEFLHNGSMEGVTSDVIENLRALAKRLEGVRELFGVPVIITSGFRTKVHNRAVGGVDNSQHCFGKAADFVVKGHTPTEVYEKLKDTWQGGLGHYPDTPKRKGWIHLDIRQHRDRWEG